MLVAFSLGGIHWRKYARAPGHSDCSAPSQRPLLAYWGAGYGDPIPLAGEMSAEYSVLRRSDAFDVIGDPVNGHQAIYTKTWLNTPDGTYAWKRGVGRVTSDDFLHWSDLEVVLYPDEFDPPGMEMHHASVFFHRGTYFGLMQRTDPHVRGGIMDGVPPAHGSEPVPHHGFRCRDQPGADPLRGRGPERLPGALALRAKRPSP